VHIRQMTHVLFPARTELMDPLRSESGIRRGPRLRRPMLRLDAASDRHWM
jgi:hypothetical protein